MSSREKMEARETRELVKRKAQLAREPLKFGLLFAILAILLSIGIDDVSTQVSSQLQSSIVTEFFVNPLNLPYNEAVAMFSAVNIISYLIMPIAPFYKSLADKIGRKPFLALNIILMGVSLLLCAWSPSIIIYYIGFGIKMFTTSPDMQIVYLYEVAPQKSRATFYGVVKGLGTFCIVLVPVLRAVIMGNDSTLWRNVFMVPAVLSFAIAAYIILVPRESELFLKQRVNYLQQPYEQRHPKKEKKKDVKAKKSGQKTGIFVAMKHLFKEKQLFWLTIVSVLFATAGVTFGSYMESIMSDFGMSTSDVTTALFFCPFMNLIITILAGFLSDKLGRKPVIAMAGVLSVVGFVCFNISAFAGTSPYIVGFFYGLYLPCWWTTNDFTTMMVAESSPTYNRASSMGAIALMRLVGSACGLLLPVVGALMFDHIGFGYMTVVMPFVAVGVALMIWKIRDTSGVNLSEVKYEDEE